MVHQDQAADVDSWKKDSVEKSMTRYWLALSKPETIDLWLAAQLRIAQLAMGVRAFSLWDKQSCGAALAAPCTLMGGRLMPPTLKCACARVCVCVCVRV